MKRNCNEIYITEEESKTCLIDNKRFNSSREMIWHVRKTYGLDFEHYIIGVYYDNIKPVCLKTGNPLSFKASKLGPFFHNYSKNNFQRKSHTDETKKKIKKGCEKNSIEKFGVKNVFSTDWCKKKIKEKMISRYGVDNPGKSESIVDGYRKKCSEWAINNVKNTNKSNTNIELFVKKILDAENIKYEQQKVTDVGSVDFFLTNEELYLEVDGLYWHPKKKYKLNFMQLNGCIHDFIKSNNIKNLIRVHEEDLYRVTDFKSLLSNIYSENFIFNYTTKIIERKFFEYYKNRNGIEGLRKKIKLLLKFLRTFQPSLPRIELKENLQEVISKISKYDLSTIYDSNTKRFSNKCSTLGHNYLKYHFQSYWKSCFNGNKSPINAWLDDKIMSEVIKYRIGCNDNNEIFDFSLHQMIRGLSAKRITVSFFKPILAASIYKHYIGNKSTPVVLDPCCGFGGRLLAFKSIYPNGTYVGCEPNIETYNELINLKKDANWSDDTVRIHNCKFEDFSYDDLYYDLIFTSIPYYDLEIYSNNTNYNSFDEWKNTFIRSIENYKGRNCYINCPMELSKKLNWTDIDSHIVSGVTHFNKTDDEKLEVIVKI